MNLGSMMMVPDKNDPPAMLCAKREVMGKNCKGLGHPRGMERVLGASPVTCDEGRPTLLGDQKR